jgi:hypothetical protein
MRASKRANCWLDEHHSSKRTLGNEGSGWTVEVTEMDDVGSEFYANYPQQQKRNKRTTCDLAAVSPNFRTHAVEACYLKNEAQPHPSFG